MLAAVAIGGLFGAAARYGVSTLVTATWVPWPTLAVNVSGSFALGVLAGRLAVERGRHPVLRPLLATGFLGAFTTYSALAVETLTMLQSGRVTAAALYTAGSICAGLLALWVGLSVAHGRTRRT